MGIFSRINRSSRSSSTNTSPTGSGTTTPTPAATLTQQTSSSSSSTASSVPLSTSPTTPALTLTKTSSRPGLSLTKTLTWGRRKEDKHLRRIAAWEREDANEWNAPTARRPGRKVASKQHQDLLRTFEWGQCGNMRGREGSILSGISPGCSRVASLDDVTLRKGVGVGLSREVSRSEGDLRA